MRRAGRSSVRLGQATCPTWSIAWVTFGVARRTQGCKPRHDQHRHDGRARGARHRVHSRLTGAQPLRGARDRARRPEADDPGRRPRARKSPSIGTTSASCCAPKRRHVPVLVCNAIGRCAFTAPPTTPRRALPPAPAHQAKRRHGVAWRNAPVIGVITSPDLAIATAVGMHRVNQSSLANPYAT